MNGNITREGITADLETMARVGIGGAQIFNIAGSHQNDIPPGPIDYLSPEWLDMVKHAASESERLGLELCIHNCAGWSTSGGPWVKPEHAMQALVSSEVKVDGGKRVKLKLPQPLIRNNYYRDIAIFAFPTPKDDNFRVKDWRKKAVQVGGRNRRQPDLTPLPAEAAINLDAIVEISQYLSKNGILEWDVPQGHWTIFRLGHTPTGKTNHPSPKSGEGLEIDKLSREALDVHWREGIQPILDHLGPLAGKVLNNILIDSYEAALNHWTPKLREEFQRRRGYDPTPYLPALQGRLIGDGPTTARFLWDFRRTVADLFADNYYGYFADLCREHGMLSSVEPYSSAYEFLAVAAKVDIPMGEFRVDNADHFSLRVAASSGHTHGQSIIGAESFTARPEKGRWQNYPAKLRPVGDKVWTKGINRLILATFAHQPWLVEHNGKYYNFYNAANGHIEQTGVALSDNLLEWKRYENNPVIPNGPEGSFNEKFSSDSKIFWDKDHWISFFFGVGRGGAHVMVAFSRDLYHWTVDPDPIYKAGGNPSGLDNKYAHKISLVWNPANETYYMFYCAVDKDNKRGIGLITSMPLDK